MSIDRTSAGSDQNVESVEQKPAADHRPPPPPDRPGSSGYPSRADSRAGAAAANTTDQPPATDAREEKSGNTDTAAEPSDGQGTGAVDKREASVGAESNESEESLTEGTDALSGRTDIGTGPEHAERPVARNTETSENRDDSGRQEMPPNVSDNSGESTGPAGRSSASTEVASRPTTNAPQTVPSAKAASRPEPR